MDVALSKTLDGAIIQGPMHVSFATVKLHSSAYHMTVYLRRRHTALSHQLSTLIYAYRTALVM